MGEFVELFLKFDFEFDDVVLCVYDEDVIVIGVDDCGFVGLCWVIVGDWV